ncbi:tRNA-dihydrouridine(16/17) synthase [NAD(P)(+)]-like isoform X2 [Apostichopus japonicus]|uniref:tRNA-dihydrouridine(16/17) synthase [NAD(P)(+)]-like isoform X2 n=1 Tax=Stichopus japonicus TaxID=307972 RepID=UPI003AB1B46F
MLMYRKCLSLFIKVKHSRRRSTITLNCIFANIIKPMEKKSGHDFWQTSLGGAKYVVAPMVAQSELPWRLLSRRHGAQLCYTPMYHSHLFCRDAAYRKVAMETNGEDKPLIFQFCANDPDVFLEAARHVEHICQGVDLNLGCPQGIARRGHYGAFLQDEWDLVFKIINHAHKNLSIPVTCKIRVLETLEKTVEYAKMLERAGAQIITVHGRTREMKGQLTGLADWNLIKAIKEAVNVPVFANGNIQSLVDVERCLEETGVDGVMSAEGNLHNPYLFKGKYPTVWEAADEYLELVKQFPCSMSTIRSHLFRLWHHTLEKHQQLRIPLSKARTLEDMVAVSQEVKKCCMEDVNEGDEEKHKDGKVQPYWLCQPYFRPSPEETLKKVEATAAKKRAMEEFSEKGEDNTITDSSQPQMKYDLCPCGNPCSLRCSFKICKQCCKKKCKALPADCTGHNLLIKTRLERKRREAEEKAKIKVDLKNQIVVEDSSIQGKQTSGGIKKESESTKGVNHPKVPVDTLEHAKEISTIKEDILNGERTSFEESETLNRQNESDGTSFTKDEENTCDVESVR